MYNDAGGDINAMRRAQYAQNKDKINAQKRAAYAQRKLLKGNADGILNEGSEGYVPITRESIEAVRPLFLSDAGHGGKQCPLRARTSACWHRRQRIRRHRDRAQLWIDHAAAGQNVGRPKAGQRAHIEPECALHLDTQTILDG